MSTQTKIRLYSIQKNAKLDRNLKIFNGYVLPYEFRYIQSDVENFNVHDDDVWVTGFPRSGVTWLQEMIWLLSNELNYEAAKIPLAARFPHIESDPITRYRLGESPAGVPTVPTSNTVRRAGPVQRGRFIKSHLPWELLPERIRDGTRRPKIIHVIRNPKDICVSYYHHLKLYPKFLNLTFDDYFNDFISDTLIYTPFWNNTLSYWNRRFESNILIVTYEEMKKNLGNSIRKVSNFLEVEIGSEQVSRLEQHLNFGQMKKSKTSELGNKFFRKGIVGGYRDELTQEQIRILNVWIEQNTVDTGLIFEEFFYM